MGQTLTHGIYLPDEGERNCYNGLAANWQLLDGAVGTVAEHSTQIAGKAPAVHTHTKADITDFPAYGNTAGTICEGNDSRLSDARTPVAHTHVTANVTDLLNTSHEWTKTQKYSDANAIMIKNNGVEIGNEPSAYNEQRFIFIDKNNQQIAAIKYQNQLSSSNTFNNSLEFSATDKFKNGVRDATGTAITAVLRIGLWNDGTKYIYNDARWRTNLLPFTNNATDLGSSSYQWNNLYASKIRQIDSFSSYADVYQVLDSSSNRIVSFRITKGANKNTLGINVHDQNNSAPKGLVIENDLSNNITITGGGVNNYLGTSTNKWATLNGNNPGALSLPDYSNIAAIDTTNWSKAGDMIVYTPTFDGWLQITIPNDDDDQGNKRNMISILDSGTSPLAGFSVSNILGPRLYFLYPVRASRVYWLYIKSYSEIITVARLVKCQGNV